MNQAEKVFVANNAYTGGPEHGFSAAFNPGVQTLPAGRQLGPMFRALPVDIVFEKDVAVLLRDGVTIYVDILRPANTERAPVLVAWSPYGKSQGSSPGAVGLFAMLGMKPGRLSGLEKFEGPDPAYWCAHGYAVCNPDPRGVAYSEGDSVMFDRQEGRDCYDLIEWLAVQDWCTGKVGMSGTSYLANAQWFTAAEQPPHLAAINPEEGLSDIYRDLVMRGGMPDLGFAERLRRSYAGKNKREDNALEAERYPLMNTLWEDKIPDFNKIAVPAYVVGSYSNTLHTVGTFRAWRRMASSQKWLRVHNVQEWPDYYDDANTEDLRRFFDRYLKGEENGWETTPRVRYALHDFKGGDRLNLPAEVFPPETVAYTKYYLDGASRALILQSPANPMTAEYSTEADPALVSFSFRFERETIMVGYPKVRLWVETKGADDMDLFFLIQKLDAQGSALEHFTVPNQGPRMQDITERGASILRYKGSNGRLRASARRLDAMLTTDEVPAHSFDRVEKLAPGEVVEIAVDLSPIGLIFYPGEQLRLVVSGRNLLGPMMPMVDDYTPANTGQHIIHTGGGRGSYLQLPVAVA